MDTAGDEAARADFGQRPDDRTRVHERPPPRARSLQPFGDAEAGGRVADRHQHRDPGREVVRTDHGQVADRGSGRPVVDEPGDVHTGSEGDVERLSPHTPGTRDPQLHVPMVAWPEYSGRDARRVDLEAWAVAVRFGEVIPPARSTSLRLDAAGFGLVLLLAGWVGLFAGNGSGRSAPVLWLLFGLVVATSAGRVLAGRAGLVPRMVAVGIAGSMVLTWPGLLRAGGAPTGYANANATLASLGVIAALAAARTGRSRPDRRGWVALGVFLGACTALTGSVAGVLSLVVALGLLALSAIARWPGFAIIGGMITVSLAVGVTTAIAVGGDPAGLSERADVRGQLWAAAVDLVDEAPARGIGAGEFRERSPVSSDPDLRWAHHGYLQAAAEYGVVGLLLVLALAGWVWVRLWHNSSRDPAAAALGGSYVLVVGLHATVDYVWHVPAVMLVLGLLVGNGFGRGIRSSRRGQLGASVFSPIRRSSQ